MSEVAKPNRAKWRKRNEHPKKPGMYECAVQWTSAMPKLATWNLEWDGHGFLVPFPMVVHWWRPLPKEKAND